MRFNLLEINLSTREKKVHDVTEDIRKYLGGRGYGAKLLRDRVPQGADPLGEENILYIGVGPITGPLGSVTNFSAKSPLTLIRGHSNMNGHFGTELIYAGYNAGILITGKSPRPVYLHPIANRAKRRDSTGKNSWSGGRNSISLMTLNPTGSLPKRRSKESGWSLSFQC
jgi:aldehyde:ferredoxin oxidoreductase